MTAHAVFITHHTKPGQRSSAAAVWTQIMQPAIQANPNHLAYVYTLPDDEPDVIRALMHEESRVEVRNLAVDINLQRTGVGTELMGAVLNWCRVQGLRSVELTFHPANEVAARLYRRAGFAPTGARRNGQALWSISLA